MAKVYDLTEPEIQIIKLLRRTAPNIWHVAIQLGTDGQWIIEEIREETMGLLVLQGKGATFNQAWTSRRDPRPLDPVTEANSGAPEAWQGEVAARVTRPKPRLHVIKGDGDGDES